MVFEILYYEFMQKALISGILISVLCSTVGVFLVLKRLSLFGDGLAHLAFGGVAVGLLLGIEPILSALIVSTAGALGMQRLLDKTKVYGDAATALILSFGMAIAILIIGIVKGFNVNLFSYLFGSILAISNFDILVISAVFVFAMIFLVAFYKKLAFITFNEDVAKISGINTGLVNGILAVVTAMTVVITMRAVGILLTSALLVIPAITALQLASSLKRTILYSIIISVFAVMSGIVASFYLDLPPSGTIVIFLCLFFIICVLAGKNKK